jgi:hypothetical protein
METVNIKTIKFKSDQFNNNQAISSVKDPRNGLVETLLNKSNVPDKNFPFAQAGVNLTDDQNNTFLQKQFNEILRETMQELKEPVKVNLIKDFARNSELRNVIDKGIV